jgi:hypothetical protein
MRTGLIAAQCRTPTGELRAQLPLAGRSVLAWQVALLRRLGAERIICLCDGPMGDVLQLQHAVEASGGSFHALQSFAALPALVRAEDELIVLRDGLVPDVALASNLVSPKTGQSKAVLCLPSDHPLALAHPDTFERIDAERHWAGLLMMRGAPVQQLAEFPTDADAVSVLLRLALQAGTPCQILTADQVTDTTWLLSESVDAARRNEAALIYHAAPPSDWRAPLSALAAGIVRKTATYGMEEGHRIAAAMALLTILSGVMIAAWGAGTGGLIFAALGAFAGQIAAGFATMDARLRQIEAKASRSSVLRGGVDIGAAVTAWFVLSTWPDFYPLAVCGPIVIGLARLVETDRTGPVRVIASDRASLLLALALAAGLGHATLVTAMLSAVLIAALLLKPRKN